jgi:hypothetical protein
MKNKAIKKMKLPLAAAFIALGGCFLAVFGLILAQGSQICPPGEISGCKICNSSGTDWINDNLKCSGGKICIDGECVANCRDECSVAGLKECRGQGYCVCVKSESTGCLHWSNVFSCPGGQNCVAGICAKGVADDSAKLILSGLSPVGVVKEEKITLSASTNVAANCRYDIIDQGFDLMRGKFKTLNYFSHIEPITLQKSGQFVFYVKCRGTDGDIGSGNISFEYSLRQNPVDSNEKISDDKPQIIDSAPLEKTPPAISELKPSGKIGSGETEISAATDKAAQCNYDVFDTDYDSMENSMIADATEKIHYHKITLSLPGKYVYYVRCRDNDGNKNPTSAKINFEFEDAQNAFSENGARLLALENLSPRGAIYQNEAVLILSTGEDSECRYSLEDAEFEKMSELFNTQDGQLHEVQIFLENYGNYHYFARCRSRNDAEREAFALIDFEYRNPESSLTSAPANSCQQYSLDQGDDNCDNGENCVCDPDCAEVYEYDPDCDHITVEKKGGGFALWPVIVALAVFGFLFAGALFVGKKMKKKNTAGKPFPPAAGEEDESRYLN